MARKAGRETMRQDYQNLKAGLKALRDEIKVQVHLASMDAKDEWKKLEPRLNEAEQLVDAVSEASLAAARELEARAKVLRDRLKAVHQAQRVAHR